MITNIILIILLVIGALCVLMESFNALSAHRSSQAIQLLAQDIISSTFAIKALYSVLSDADKAKCDVEFKRLSDEFTNRQQGN